MVTGKEDITSVSVNVPLRKSELLETKANIEKILSHGASAGWQPKYDLKDVINSY